MNLLAGRIRKSIVLPGRLYRYLLWLYFRFDKWHVSSIHDRKYAKDIIRYLNSKPPQGRNSVLEIGCGLGDIIRRVNYQQRTGYDMDRNALKAAAFLARTSFTRAINFAWFKFPESALGGKSDTIVMVNWIHHIEPQILKEKIREYFLHNLSAGGEIVIDTVQNRAYEINHSISFLASGLNCSVLKIGADVDGREIFAIQKQ
jgi:SAM-dependent methyltransferase